MSETNNQLSPQSVLPGLEIVSGFHRGVRLDLEDGDYTIGPDAESDIVLHDEGVLQRHAVLRVSDGDARVDAVGGALIVNNLEVPMGHGCRVRMPAVISIGEAGIRLTPGGKSAAGIPAGLKSLSDPIAAHPIKVAVGVLVGALAITSATNATREPRPSTTDIASMEGDFGEIRHAGDIGQIPLDGAAAGDAAADALRDKLRASGITTIHVKEDANRVLADGRVSELQAGEWTSIQRWFDLKHGSSILLAANVAIGDMSGPAPVQLQAVWFGKRPYIIAGSGTRYYEGAILESGWIIRRIAEDRVLLAKGGETLALTYR